MFTDKPDPWPTRAVLLWLTSTGLRPSNASSLRNFFKRNQKTPKPRLESLPLPGVVNSPFLLAIRYKGGGGDLFPGWFSVKKRILAVHTVEHYRGASADKLLKRTWQQTINCQQISLPYHGVCPLFKTLSLITGNRIGARTMCQKQW